MFKVKKNVDLPSSMRTVQLTNPVYSDLKMYPLPTDLTLNGIVNLRPITPDDSYYDFTNLNQRQFKVEEKFNNSSKRYAIRNINGVQYLLIHDTTTDPTIIQPFDSLTANGSIGAIGAVTAISVDGLQKVSGGASLTFSTGAGSSNGVSGTLLTALDLSTQNDIIAYVYLPTLSNVSGVTLRLGQSVGSYFQGTAATDFFGNAFVVGWNLVRIPKASFSVGAGAPTWTGVLYWGYEIVGTLVGIISGWRIDSLVANLGALFEIDYYGDNQFQDVTGTRIAKPSVDTDQIIISGDEIDIFTDQFIELMTVDLKQQGATIDFQEYGGNKLLASYENFKFKFPSQRQLMTTGYGSHPAGRVNQ